MPVLVAFAMLCVLGLAVRYPRGGVVCWVVAMETSPDQWLDGVVGGGHEAIIGAMKGFGLVLVGVLAARGGVRWDRFSPAFGFAVMFLVGVVHGLYPGLSLVESLRSLMGSAGPFLFGFVVLRPGFLLAVEAACLWGPVATVGFGAVLAVLGLDHMYAIEQGAIRLGASGQAPFLAGFALIGVYAGLRRWVTGNAGAVWLVALNLVIVVLTGARMPLALAMGVMLALLAMRRRVTALAAFGALAALMVLFVGAFSFLRVIDLAQLGEAGSLSNRDLVWPYFEAALAGSPFVGWGVGAGKVVIPLSSNLVSLIGTNAAHDEYLRIGTEGGVLGLALLIGLMVAWLRRGVSGLAPDEGRLMVLVFVAFAMHSATDNTMIATTSSVFFLWVSAVFASGGEAARESPICSSAAPPSPFPSPFPWASKPVLRRGHSPW